MSRAQAAGGAAVLAVALAGGTAAARAPEEVLSWATTTPGGAAPDVASATAGPRLLWAKVLPQDQYRSMVQPERAAPVRIGDRLWVATARLGAILTVDPYTGLLGPQIDTHGSVEARLSWDAASGAVYAADTEGWLYRIAADTAEITWEYEIGEASVTSPRLDGDRVYFRTLSDQVGAVAAETGAWAWSYGREAPAQSSILGSSPVVLGGELVYAGFADGTLVALDRADGTARWEVPLAAPGARWKDVDVLALVSSDCLFASAWEGPSMCLDPQSGSIRWTQQLAAWGDPLVVDGRILVPGDGGTVTSLDLATGEIQWTFTAPRATNDKVGRQSLSPAVMWGDTPVVATSRGHLYGLSLTDGAQQWAFRPWVDNFGFLSSPTPDDGLLFALSGSGVLYALADDDWAGPPWLVSDGDQWDVLPLDEGHAHLREPSAQGAVSAETEDDASRSWDPPL